VEDGEITSAAGLEMTWQALGELFAQLGCIKNLQQSMKSCSISLTER
jgi:hypothetical protein